MHDVLNAVAAEAVKCPPAGVPDSWGHFPHGADVGISGCGPTKAEAFRQAAIALTAVVTDPCRVRCTAAVPLYCRAVNDDLLLVEWLNAIVYEMAVRGMVFGDYVVDCGEGTLSATAYGEPVDRERHQPAVEIKGATLTALRVEHDTDGWRVQCVLDV